MEKASEHRKPMHEKASETKRTLKAVCKRVKTEEMRKYEAIGEEAAERRTQQQCILRGGVYLRHRLRKALLKEMSTLLSHPDTIPQRCEECNMRRAGVQACKKLSLSPTRNSYMRRVLLTVILVLSDLIGV
jgi:hypothetical protein